MDKCMNTETNNMVRRCVEMRKTDMEGRYRCFQSLFGGSIADLNKVECIFSLQGEMRITNLT